MSMAVRLSQGLHHRAAALLIYFQLLLVLKKHPISTWSDPLPSFKYIAQIYDLSLLIYLTIINIFNTYYLKQRLSIFRSSFSVRPLHKVLDVCPNAFKYIAL